MVKIEQAPSRKTFLEAELFGYEKGAFTGAVKTKKGLFELAHGGGVSRRNWRDAPCHAGKASDISGGPLL